MEFEELQRARRTALIDALSAVERASFMDRARDRLAVEAANAEARRRFDILAGFDDQIIMATNLNKLQ